MADKKVSELDSITGVGTAADDLFLIVDTSGSVTKKITRAELNNAIEQDVLSSIEITDITNDVNIQGTVTADGLTVDSDSATATIKAFQPKFILDDDSAVGAGSDKLIIQSAASQSDGDYEFVLNNDQTSSADRTAMKIKGNGDISFFADDGTTQGLYWDASTQRLGLGATAPNAKIEAYEAAAGTNSIIRTTVNGASGGDPYIRYSVSGVLDWSTGVDNSDSDKFKISKGTTLGTDDYLTIESGGNVGIGTSSPSTPLHISGSSDVVATVESTDRYSHVDLTDTLGSSRITNDGGNLRLRSDNSDAVASSYLTMEVDGSEAVRITSGGLVGIGTDSPSEELTVSKSDDARISITSSGTGKAAMTGLLEFDGSDGRHGYIGPVGGVMRLNTDGGYDIIFQPAGTEKVRFTSTGLVGIGDSSPDAKLDVRSTSGTTTDIGIFEAAVGGYTGTSLIAANTLGPASTYNLFECITDSDADAGGPFTEFVVRGDGNVGIGTSSPSELLHVDSASGDAAIRIDGSTRSFKIEQNNFGLRFVDVDAGSAERMRIDSAGRFLIGSTGNNVVGSSARFQVSYAKTGEFGIHIRPSDNNTGGGEPMLFQNQAGTSIGSISANATNVAYNTSSDYRLKENVADMTGAIDRVKALAPKRFNFIADADRTVDGFLAHEAQAVVPEAVTGTHNEVDADGNAVMQGIDQSKLVPLLTGALQEAIAKIETLEARVAALEAN